MTSVDGWSTPHPGSPPDSPFPHVFRPVTLGTGFDSVALACGGEADARLYEELAGQRPMYTCSATRSPPGGWSPRPGRRTPWPSSCSNKSSGGAGAGNRRATTPGPALPVRINGNIFPNERWCFFQLIRPR